MAIAARSWLFAPGDSEKKMTKAADGPADIVLIDLEDAVVESEKPRARGLVRAFLEARERGHDRLWVRVNPLDGPHTLADLAAVMPGRPGGIMLPKAAGRGDIERLDHYLAAFEAAHGIAPGATRVIALSGETPAGVLASAGYAGAPRLVALSWGAEDLAAAIGARTNRAADGGYASPYELARNLCLLGAAAAGIAAIETIETDFRDPDRLRARAEAMRAQGFRGMLAIHPAQVEIINQAFTPSEAELVEARAIVALFAAHPSAGTIGHRGAMLDRPHLARAEALLRLAAGAERGS